MLTVYGYKKCGTCRKAIAWLASRGMAFTFVDITEKPPTQKTLKTVLVAGGYELKHLYNTSGMQYRSLGISEKRKTLSEADQIKLLSGNGMLIKRPIVTDGKACTVGFRESVFEATWGA